MKLVVCESCEAEFSIKHTMDELREMSHYQITPDTHQQTALHNGESRCQRRSRFDRRFIRQALNHSHPLWPLLKQNSVPRRRQHRHRFHKTTHGKTQRS